MWSSGWALIPNDCCLYKKRRTDMETWGHKGRRPYNNGNKDRYTVAASREIAATDSYQKLRWGRNGSSPEPLWGSWPSWHTDFRFLTSRTVRQCISVPLSHSVCVFFFFLCCCYDSPRKHVYLLNSALQGLLILKGFKFQRNWLILFKLSWDFTNF